MASETVTRTQCDSVRDAALVCRNNVEVVTLTLAFARLDDTLTTRLQDATARLKRSLSAFDDAWQAPGVRDWFVLHRPNPALRFGECLTACEYARDCCGCAAVAVEIATDEVAGGLSEARVFIENMSAPTEADILAEWSAAVASFRDATNKEHSPWIGAPEMIAVMLSNGIRGTGERNITRKKQEWQAESQVGTNNRLFRFKLSTLDELGIKYPAAWDKTEG